MSELSVTRTTGLVHSPYDRNAVSFSDMVENSVVVQSYELVKDDLADKLVGVPFLITRVTFRPGMADPHKKGRTLAYVSCEAVIADQKYLDRRKKNLDDTPFLPEDHIVINDGSTGIYRQVLATLESQGYVTLPEGPAGGGKGESRFDLPPAEWGETNVGDTEVMEVTSDYPGFITYSADVRIFAPHGVRLSEYTNEYTQGGKTRYLA